MNFEIHLVFDPLLFVNPFIGSGGHGHVFVGASVPFGLVQLGPLQQNCGWDCSSGYHHSQRTIRGFAHTHLSGTGIPDFGDILIQPYLRPYLTTDAPDGYESFFSHENETASPGHYSVILESVFGSIEVNLTASERCGFHKIDFRGNLPGRIILDLGEGAGNWADSATIVQARNSLWLGTRSSVGWSRRRIHFAFELNTTPTNVDWIDGRKLVLTFGITRQQLLLKVGISPRDRSNALLNLRSELPDWDFDEVLIRAREKWRVFLNRVSVTGSISTTFYTALFHCGIHPSLFSDVNFRPRYTVFSLWDTYRAVHPLLIIGCSTPGVA
jgi:putative alpha-1,2-mannosidase